MSRFERLTCHRRFTLGKHSAGVEQRRVAACIAFAQVNNGELVLGRRRGYLQVLEDEGVGVAVKI